MCLGKNSAQAANVRRSRFGCAVRCSGLHLFEKMLAFLREAVDFVDSLKTGIQRIPVFLCIVCGNQPSAALFFFRQASSTAQNTRER